MISATDTKNTFYILNKKEKTPIIFIEIEPAIMGYETVFWEEMRINGSIQ